MFALAIAATLLLAASAARAQALLASGGTGTFVPGTQKGGDDQAFGRSRGGLSTKIHTASVSEHWVLEVFLSGGQAGDAPTGEELLDEVLAYEAIEAVRGDRAYDSDAIRAMIAAAGKEAVILPRCNRLRPAVYD